MERCSAPLHLQRVISSRQTVGQYANDLVKIRKRSGLEPRDDALIFDAQRFIHAAGVSLRQSQQLVAKIRVVWWVDVPTKEAQNTSRQKKPRQQYKASGKTCLVPASCFQVMPLLTISLQSKMRWSIPRGRTLLNPVVCSMSHTRVDIVDKKTEYPRVTHRRTRNKHSIVVVVNSAIFRDWGRQKAADCLLHCL